MRGTWTPVLAGSSIAGAQTYSVQQGAYTRVGRVITVTETISIASLNNCTKGLQP